MFWAELCVMPWKTSHTTYKIWIPVFYTWFFFFHLFHLFVSFRSAFSWITSAAVIQMFEFLCCTRVVLSCKWWKSHKWMGLKIIMEKLTLLIITYLYPHKASTTTRCFFLPLSLSLGAASRNLSESFNRTAPLIQIRQRASCSVPWFKMNKWIIYLEQRALFL